MNEKKRLVQLIHGSERRVAMVDKSSLLLLNNTSSIYELTMIAIDSGENINKLIKGRLSKEHLDYDLIYEGKSSWKLLPSFDHPSNTFACLVSGTGLTHKNSALNRQIMHQSAENKLTDSMVMYQWGLEGGQPEGRKIGVQPEWFYKGPGTILKGHGEALEIPAYGNDGGEEPEIAGIYVIDKKGNPYRVGFTTGNEFSDHVMERKNYLYLAPSKLRNCAIGPEIVVDGAFDEINGTVKILRRDEIIWSQEIRTGEKIMAHSLANLEYHHFKYAQHRLPGQAHVHFFGADAFSFGKGISLEDGDVMSVEWSGFGRPLKNILSIDGEEEKWIEVKGIS